MNQIKLQLWGFDWRRVVVTILGSLIILTVSFFVYTLIINWLADLKYRVTQIRLSQEASRIEKIANPSIQPLPSSLPLLIFADWSNEKTWAVPPSGQKARIEKREIISDAIRNKERTNYFLQNFSDKQDFRELAEVVYLDEAGTHGIVFEWVGLDRQYFLYNRLTGSIIKWPLRNLKQQCNDLFYWNPEENIVYARTIIDDNSSYKILNYCVLNSKNQQLVSQYNLNGESYLKDDFFDPESKKLLIFSNSLDRLNAIKAQVINFSQGWFIPVNINDWQDYVIEYKSFKNGKILVKNNKAAEFIIFNLRNESIETIINLPEVLPASASYYLVSISPKYRYFYFRTFSKPNLTDWIYDLDQSKFIGKFNPDEVWNGVYPNTVQPSFTGWVE